MKDNKPVLKLVGTDGNAFAIMGKAGKCARENGWSKEKIVSLMEEMTSGDYDNLLQTAMKYFDVR